MFSLQGMSTTCCLLHIQYVGNEESASATNLLYFTFPNTSACMGTRHCRTCNLYKGKTYIYDPLSLACCMTLFSYLQQLEYYHDTFMKLRAFWLCGRKCFKCLCCQQTMPNTHTHTHAHHCNCFVEDETCRAISLWRTPSRLAVS